MVGVNIQIRNTTQKKPDEITHIAFSDESSQNIGHYGGISMVSLPISNLENFQRNVVNILDTSNIREFKWSKLRNAKYRLAGIKLIDETILQLNQKRIRIDALVWDKTDSRHAVQSRDDSENLQRMYYHLMKNVMEKRWPDDTLWRLYPDENSAMDWNSLKDYLFKGSAISIPPSLFRDYFYIKTKYYIRDILACKSHEEPICQIADLFVGMAVFSREEFSQYQRWCSVNSEQQSLFDFEGSTLFSNAQNERFFVMRYFDNLCKNNNFGLALRSSKGFKTHDPAKPLNFWFYIPQVESDQAPIK